MLSSKFLCGFPWESHKSVKVNCHMARIFRLFICSGLFLMGSVAGFAESPVNDHPNVLLILTDDQGYADLSLHGNPYLKTPVMDSLARDSVRLDRFYVSPVCAPTRASLLTGRYHLRTGAAGVTRRREVIRPEEVTLAELFGENGYKTGCFGKWHNGSFYPETPNAQGFDEFYGFTYGHITEYFDPVLNRNGAPERAKGYITDILTDAALDFMLDTSAEGNPFFCYLPYNAPHTPGMVPQHYFERFKAQGLDDRVAAIYGMIESIDDNLRRLFERMEEAGLDQNTMVIFMGDNGPLRVPGRFNAGMKGYKAQCDEGGVRVPCFIRWPGKLEKNRIFNERLSHIDILPTLAEFCGLKGSEDLDLDGVSFASLLTGEDAEWPDRMLLTFSFGDEARIQDWGSVHWQNWIAVKYAEKGWSLFDLEQDPGQKNDVAGEHGDVLKRLSTAFEARLNQSLELARPSPIPVGYESHPHVVMEAHDATLHAPEGDGIGYNYPAGFAHHWITNWTRTDAYPEWTIEVKSPGRYGVALHYCMKESLAGVTGYVEADGSSVGFSVDQPFDPDIVYQPFLIDGEAEKYAKKPWRRQEVGTVELAAGQHPVTVRVEKLPGGEAFELKALELIRLE